MNLQEQRAHYRAVRARILAASLPSERKLAAPRVQLPACREEPAREVVLVPPVEQAPPANSGISEFRQWGIPPMPARLRQVALRVCKRTKVPFGDMASSCRHAPFVLARQRLFFALYHLNPPLSLPAIGRLCGGRDHTTVLHGIRAHAARLGRTVPSRRPERAGT